MRRSLIPTVHARCGKEYLTPTDRVVQAEDGTWCLVRVLDADAVANAVAAGTLSALSADGRGVPHPPPSYLRLA